MNNNLENSNNNNIINKKENEITKVIKLVEGNENFEEKEIRNEIKIQKNENLLKKNEQFTESKFPSHMIQKDCSKYIIEEDYEKSIKVYREASKDKEHPPFCRVWTIIESALIKTGAITKVTKDKMDNLSSKSRKILQKITDAQLIKVFTLIHDFAITHSKFSIYDIDRYFDEQMTKESESRNYKKQKTSHNVN